MINRPTPLLCRKYTVIPGHRSSCSYMQKSDVDCCVATLDALVSVGLDELLGLSRKIVALGTLMVLENRRISNRVMYNTGSPWVMSRTASRSLG